MGSFAASMISEIVIGTNEIVTALVIIVLVLLAIYLVKRI